MGQLGSGAQSWVGIRLVDKVSAGSGSESSRYQWYRLVLGITNTTADTGRYVAAVTSLPVSVSVLGIGMGEGQIALFQQLVYALLHWGRFSRFSRFNQFSN